ncbi:hypothetical protein Baya_10354 [Bagarius yarrelli]|uniref:Uncharacterized protein n=1 Tax=Bagarius yarrelli TaxID=175774 RepID=A0A556UYU0_BAGYA|nr:hypothetical protein Baya_10354 [Bagarius yarrelli]
MPQVTGPMLLQLALLLCALPAQYLIMHILDVWKSARRSYLNTTAWVDWIHSWMPKLPLLGAEEELDDMPGFIMQLESLMRDNEFGYFAEIPTLEQYFSHFNGKKFVMLDWLKELYPED